MSTMTELRSLSSEEFRAVFRNHAAGVAVITADAGNGPVGLTATSVFSVSADPPLLVFSVDNLSSSALTLRDAENVVVHLLGADLLHIAKLFSTSGIDRFADLSLWSRLPTGEPYLPNSPSWIRGRIVNRMPAGGSTVFAVHALEASIAPDDLLTSPLVYHNRRWHSLGNHSTIAA